MYKLIATDMDGTLLNDNKKISPLDVQRIKEATKLGVKFILTTGRAYHGVIPYAKELALENEIHVCENGAILMKDLKSYKTLSAFEAEDLNKLISHLRKTCKHFVIGNGEEVYFEEYSNINRVMTPNNGNIPFVKVKDLSTIKNALKINAYKETKEDVERILSKKFNSIIGCESHEFLIDFYPANIDKFKGLKKIMDLYNIKKEEVIALGDSNNDLALLEKAGLSVCVRNAMASLKEKADVTIEATNNESPLSCVIEKYIL